MVDKPKHEGSDPFTYKKQEQKLKVEKEKLKQLKNQRFASA